MTGIELRPILVDTASDDREGRLILFDEHLVGVVVRLDGDEQGALRGRWSLEAAFGPLESACPDSFAQLADVEIWALKTIAKFRDG